MDHHHHNHKDHIGNPMEHSMPSMHSMSFHFGTQETILFDFWKIESVGGLIFSSLIIFLIAFLMESIRFFRAFRKAQKPSASASPTKFQPTIPDLIDPVLQAAQLGLAYFLMLIFMTFNVWICVVTVVGEVLSHLFYNAIFPFLYSGATNLAENHC
ncbi:unnamed protein product [Caenorhabditis angaria]|uniref:Copper transport protein n=1 Tax=Caenorhabditis angaria TaxID=860376 RepID=A0A9P1N3Y2_9PELO|nr:unnamed protein product [Caenorhabditis angaria]